MAHNKIRSITVYCGSSTGTSCAYLESAIALGKYLAEEGIRLIYGGGQKGLMGQIADSCLEHGGEVVGIIPEFMVDLEWAHTGLTELELVKTMSDRKERLLALGDAVIILPGGIGTLEEFAEVLSWSQLHIHTKAIAFLNVENYYDDFFRFFQHIVDEGFSPANTARLFLVNKDIASLMEEIEDFKHHGIVKTTS